MGGEGETRGGFDEGNVKEKGRRDGGRDLAHPKILAWRRRLLYVLCQIDDRLPV